MRRAIGGTDCGCCAAYYRPEMAPYLAKYGNATDLAMRLLFGIERERTAIMGRGIDAEPRLRKALVDAYGYRLQQHERPWIVRHPKYEFATCSPDDVVDGEPVLIEIKSTSVFARSKWGPPGTDAIPPLYMAQVQWNMEILDLPRCLVFVGFGRDSEGQFLYEATEPFWVERDRELAEMLLGYAERFVKEFIEPRKLPPLTPVNNRRKYSQLQKEATP